MDKPRKLAYSAVALGFLLISLAMFLVLFFLVSLTFLVAGWILIFGGAIKLWLYSKEANKKIQIQKETAKRVEQQTLQKAAEAQNAVDEVNSSGTYLVFNKKKELLTQIETLQNEIQGNQKTEMRLKNMGLVFQFFNLLPMLTVMENIELPMALNGIKKQQRKQRANELLEFFEITKLAERYPDNLSGGEKQRVAIIRALSNYPALLLADEPTSSLDDENSALLLDLLKKISTEQKVAVMLTSTDLYEKMPTTKDFMLKEGKIQLINQTKIE